MEWEIENAQKAPLENRWNPHKLCQNCEPKFGEIFKLGQESGTETLEFFQDQLKEANRRLGAFAKSRRRHFLESPSFTPEMMDQMDRESGPVPFWWTPTIGGIMEKIADRRDKRISSTSSEAQE